MGIEELLPLIIFILSTATEGQKLINDLMRIINKKKLEALEYKKNIMSMSNDIDILNTNLIEVNKELEFDTAILDNKQKEFDLLNKAQTDLDLLNKVDNLKADLATIKNSKDRLDDSGGNNEFYNKLIAEKEAELQLAKEEASKVSQSKKELRKVIKMNKEAVKDIQYDIDVLKTIISGNEELRTMINARIEDVNKANTSLGIQSSIEQQSDKNDANNIDSNQSIIGLSSQQETIQSNVLTLLESEHNKVTELITKYNELLAVIQQINLAKMSGNLFGNEIDIPEQNDDNTNSSDPAETAFGVPFEDISEQTEQIEERGRVSQQVADQEAKNAKVKNALMDFAMEKMKKQTTVAAVLSAVEAIKSASSMPFPGNIISIGSSLAAVFAALNKANTEGKQIVAAAEGAVINRPTLLLAGEAMNRSGTEIVMPEKNFNRYMERDIIPGILTKVHVNSKGTEQRLERVEQAIYSIGNQIPGATGKAVKRALRGKL